MFPHNDIRIAESILQLVVIIFGLMLFFAWICFCIDARRRDKERKRIQEFIESMDVDSRDRR